MSDSRAERLLPRHPIYVPSKGRYQHERAYTARMFARDGVPFYLAVEHKQADAYRALARGLGLAEDCVLDMGFDDLGMGVASARNWCIEHAIAAGASRHWTVDDNSTELIRVYRGRRLICRSGLALRVMEDFADRYENVALAGPNYAQFLPIRPAPFMLNCHVYSCVLVDNAIDARWRGPYNEDTDMCLQVLARGWCTVEFNAFLLMKKGAFADGKRVVPGGMSQLYEGDGRLRMARQLERQWPYVVDVYRRYQRPQHKVRDQWKRFDNKLRLREDVDLSALPRVDEYGMRLEAVREVRSERLRAVVEEYGR